MKKLLFILMAILMVIPLIPVTASYSPHYEYEAQMLYDLELFKGTENGFELDGVCDRLQGATMFVRLLGQESDATSNPKWHPFNDVNGSWASPYVGQMYEKGYTKGSSATEYGTGNMTANQFATFCLRALDYQDGVDFTVDTALSKMLELHIIREEAYNLMANDPVFYRDYAVKLAYNTLASEYKTRRTLPEIEQTIRDFCTGITTKEEFISKIDSYGLLSLWKTYEEDENMDNPASLNDFLEYSLKDFLKYANRSKEILLLQLYRDGVVSKENLLKNIFWIEEDMYLYTLPEFFDQYLDSTKNQFKSTVIEKGECYLGDISLKTISTHPNKAWEAYSDEYNIITTDPFSSSPSFSHSPYDVYEMIYGPMRRCEYYIKGYDVDLTEQEKSIVKFVQSEFLNKVTEDMDAYDKVMLASNFLWDNITYDRVAPAVASKSFLYLFEHKKAVCCGFSQAFQFLMKLVDVECYVLSTDVSKTPELLENHAWNVVRLDDGKLYNVDTSSSGAKATNNPFMPLDASILKYADYERNYILKPDFGDPRDIKR